MRVPLGNVPARGGVRRLLASLAAITPVLTDAAVIAHLDIDSCQCQPCLWPCQAGRGVRGGKERAGYTVTRRGLNPLLAAVSTPTCAPVLVGTRLRGGTANSARGAESFTAKAITTARAAGATGLLIARIGLRVLQRGSHRGVPPRRRAVLGHRPDRP